MQVTCPNCGQPIRAENINIQEMAAVCSNCDTVFQFTPPAEKAKRRKVKQPEYLALRDAETLEMSFRTNWRIGSNQNFVGTGVAAAMSLLIASITVSAFAGGDDIPFIIPIGAVFVFLLMAYLIASTVYNKTHIVMDDEQITVSRQPIPVLFEQAQKISLHGVVAIKCEETPASVKEGYDLQRYRVWAETADGGRRMIINDVTEEYAYFISQRLQERLNYDIDVSHLENHDTQSEIDIYSMIEAESQSDMM